MRRALVAAVVLALLVGTVGCRKCGGEPVRGSGDIAVDERAVRGATGVALATAGNLTIELGEEETLTIQTDDNLFDYIKTETKDGLLVIQSEPGYKLVPSSDIVYKLTLNRLDTVTLAGSGDIMGPEIHAPEVSLTVAGSGNIEMDAIFADVISVAIAGSGDVLVGRGSVGAQELAISGSGDYIAETLDSDEASVAIAGSGTVRIKVHNSLNGSIDGSGDIYYDGSPSVNSVAVSGSGSVKRMGT